MTREETLTLTDTDVTGSLMYTGMCMGEGGVWVISLNCS